MLNLKDLRTGRNLTQQQIAENLGVTQAMWSQWETGAREPSQGNKTKVAKYFGLEVNDIWKPGPKYESHGFTWHEVQHDMFLEVLIKPRDHRQFDLETPIIIKKTDIKDVYGAWCGNIVSDTYRVPQGIEYLIVINMRDGTQYLETFSEEEFLNMRERYDDIKERLQGYYPLDRSEVDDLW